MNAVTESEGSPAAVLIRALDPLDGLDLMGRRRGWPAAAVDDERTRHGLCRGPGNLTRALGITLGRNRADLASGPLTIEDHGIRPPGIGRSPRIGIRVGTDRMWRYAWTGHAAVSGQGGQVGGQRSEVKVKGQRSKVKVKGVSAPNRLRRLREAHDRDLERLAFASAQDLHRCR